MLAWEFAAGTSSSTFMDDTRTYYAITRSLEIVSEASRHLDPEMRQRYSHLNWRAIADAGNAYRHAYRSLDPSRIWITLEDDLPPLFAAIEAELARTTG